MTSYAEYQIAERAAAVPSARPTPDSVIVTRGGEHVWATPISAATDSIGRLDSWKFYVKGLGWMLPVVGGLSAGPIGHVTQEVLDEEHALALAS